MRTLLSAIFSFIAFYSLPAQSVSDSLKNTSLPALTFRSVGPAFTGGRVVDIAVNPSNKSQYFIAAGHGSLWKTNNNGTSFSPVFDNQGAYSIGSVKIDPSNNNIVWVGTGESNNQSNVIYGDGVYRSEDGGKSWKNMGLNKSEHIGGIAIDPTNSNVVYVAAYGSLRKDGGERGIYKTTDGGKTWNRSLFVSDHTGCFEVHIDPRNSNTVYAVAHQRQRKLFTGVGGGPETAIYRTTDGGATWQKIVKGLPSDDMGRIGMAISPVNSDVLYALVQSKEGSGLYKSVDRGSSWVKQSSYNPAYPFYMQKIYCDPKDENRLYSMDLFIQVSTDGGKSFKPLGEKYKHVDNHALWIDPSDTKHLINGCDGGVYETWDQGQNWTFKNNIPIAEIYKVTTDNATPFYNVYAGSQDNSSFVGPSRTINRHGISNADWYFTQGGDGFETQVDWKDDNIVYAQSQNGGLIRFDKRNGEKLYIQPTNFVDTGYRFDWDAALLISQHDNKRLYFGANRLLRTDDRGNTWQVISPDLTRGVPQKMQKLMNRSWSIDELANKGSMAQITAIAESPLDENILYAGSGDGLINYTNDGGKTWKRSVITGLPEYARVHNMVASRHNKMVAYAACQNFIDGDYNPYLIKTSDGGKTWQYINNDLPKLGSTYSIAEDHIDKGLLFAGTQFGVFVSINGGQNWIPLKNGIPAEAIMDMEIQKRENDLVVGTFGRGIYILDDYSPLRNLSKDVFQKEAMLFPVKEAKMYIEATPLGYKGKGFQGESYYAAKNAEPGAVFTYFIKSDPKTLKERRREIEKEKLKKEEDIDYPSYQTLKKEQQEPETYLLFTITDDQGNVIRKMKANASAGLNRITWDFRYPPFSPISTSPASEGAPWDEPDMGYMVVPGTYKVSLSKFDNGKFYELSAPVSFTCSTLNTSSLPLTDKAALNTFNKKVADLTRAMNAADAYRNDLAGKLPYLEKAVLDASNVPNDTYGQVLAIKTKLDSINVKLNGDPLRARYEGVSPISLKGRVDYIAGSLWSTTSAPTTTFMQNYDIAASQFSGILTALQEISNDVQQVENTLDKYGAPYTPGRLPKWKQ
jgi:photosystem II stability/assembly factor-like uncharacterized protein